MYTFNIFRVRTVLHSFNFLRIHPYTILANNIIQVLNFKDARITFRLFEENFMLGEEMENLIYKVEIAWTHFTIDENIIKEN